MNLKLLSLSTLCAAVMLAGCKEKTTEEPSLSIDPAESVTLEATASSQTLTITTNQPQWMFSVDESQSWCSASKGANNTLIINADYNYGETERSTTITVTAGTSAQKDILTRTITVTQAGTVNQGAQLLDRAPYYEKYPEELTTKASPSTVVTSGAIPLYFFGWGMDNDYKFSLTFPDTQTKSYRRAILNYTMGGMNGGPNDWDYTTMIFVKDKTTGNWYEITRAITPYGGSFDASWSKTFYMDVTDYLDILAVWYRDVLMFKAMNDANHLIFREEIQYIKKVADRSSYEGIQKILEALDKAKARLAANVSFDLTMELLLLTIQENS